MLWGELGDEMDSKCSSRAFVTCCLIPVVTLHDNALTTAAPISVRRPPIKLLLSFSYTRQGLNSDKHLRL